MDIKELFLSLSNDEKQDFLDFATDWLEKWTGPMKDPDGDDGYNAGDLKSRYLNEYVDSLSDPDEFDRDEAMDYASRNTEIAHKLPGIAKDLTDDARMDRAHKLIAADNFSPTPEEITIYRNYFGSDQNPERSVTDPNKLHGSLHVDLDDEEKAALMDIVAGLSPKYGA